MPAKLSANVQQFCVMELHLHYMLVRVGLSEQRGAGGEWVKGGERG